MPRLVRRAPFLERMKARFNLLDWALWISEELETSDWDSKGVATTAGLSFNLIFMVARANTGASTYEDVDDVFADIEVGSSWFKWFSIFMVNSLTVISLVNAVATFIRRKQYRLFESSIETQPNTPSAIRVRVDSPPVQSSPLRFLKTVIGDTSAQSRAHPDATRDVWEVSVWDPLPICLRLFCFFSPGHVLVYWLYLPTSSSDVRPSVTVVKALVLQLLLSAQLLLLQSGFSQQIKDSAVIQKEVFNEYDTKFVHPRMHHPVRDVGTQCSGPGYEKIDEVITYAPTTVLQKGFRPNPNPNYAKHIDPDNAGIISERSASPNPFFRTPVPQRQTSPVRTQAVVSRQPHFRATSSSVQAGGGGSLGVYTAPNSPLKKATSLYDMKNTQNMASPRNNREMAYQEQAAARQRMRERSASPAKKHRDSEAPFQRRLIESGPGSGQPSRYF